MKIKKGDNVLIIAGKDRGKTGTVDAVLQQENRVVVSGVNAYKKHTKPSPRNPQGGIIEAFRSIHASNVMLLDGETNKPTRIGYIVKDGEKTRVARISGKPVGK